jgi:spore maturation protein CgeB
MIVLPPLGAARQVGVEVMKAFAHVVGGGAVKFFDCAVYTKAFSTLLKMPDEQMTVDLLNHALIVQCLDFRASHVLVLALSPVTLFTLTILKNQNIRTIHWFYEDFRRAHYWKDVLPGYDFFFGIQKGVLEDECNRAQVHFSFLPTAASSGTFTFSNDERIIDAAFVGVPSPYRVRILEFLVSRGIRAGIAGQGWNAAYNGTLKESILNGDWVSAEEGMRIYSKAKCGLNLSFDDPVNDRNNTQISPRVFDIIKSGAILVAEDVPLLYTTIPQCSHIVFSDENEALTRIQEVTQGDAPRTITRHENNALIERFHTYHIRVQTIIERTT